MKNNKGKAIGKVIEVNSNQVIVSLDKDFANFVKNAFYGVEYIGKINSFVIIRSANSKIVAQVISVEIDEDSTSDDKLHFRVGRRNLTVSLIGEIRYRSQKERYEFEYGITNYPLVGAPVEFIAEDELDIIFDKSDKEDQMPLVIGKSAVFEKYDVKINPNIFFGKHAAILGNTGSGKSCTITAILQSLFSKPDVKNAHFIIFDTNGEYKKAFTDEKNGEELPSDAKEMLKKINPLYISTDRETGTFQLPHWFLNLQECTDLFKPSEQSQLPVMTRALSIAKLLDSKTIVDKPSYFETYFYYSFLAIRQLFLEVPGGKMGQVVPKAKGVLAKINSVLTSSRLPIEESLKVDANKVISKIGKMNVDFGKLIGGVSQEEIIKACNDFIQNHKPEVEELFGANVPSYFSFSDFIKQYLPLSQLIDEAEGNARVREFCSTLTLRVQGYYNNPQYNFLFKNNYFENSLAIFLRLITGLYPQRENRDDKTDVASSFKTENQGDDFSQDEINQVVIVDLSSLSADVIENITAIVGRLVLDFLQRPDPEFERGSLPICMVLEEAHRYIPENSDSPAKQVFERIAKEGRKFGLGLVVSSQRPSELSKTVLSQCNSFIVHKVQNPEDLRYVKAMTSYMNEDISSQLPVIPRQYALVFGECVKFPILFKVKDANPIPKSRDSDYFKHWIDDNPNYPPFEKICNEWESGKKVGEANGKIPPANPTPPSTIPAPPPEEEFNTDGLPF
jgi:uncharacterized protein